MEIKWNVIKLLLSLIIFTVIVASSLINNPVIGTLIGALSAVMFYLADSLLEILKDTKKKKHALAVRG